MATYVNDLDRRPTSVFCWGSSSSSRCLSQVSAGGEVVEQCGGPHRRGPRDILASHSLVGALSLTREVGRDS